jgi:hypothetical protein
MPDAPEEGYKVYVRVPANAANISVARVRDFVKEFARLLTDDQKHVSVWTYNDNGSMDKVDTSSDHVAQRSEHAHSAGGADGALIPLYVCHNKY